MNYGSLNVASAIVDNAFGASLTVSGPGITTLSGANTYTGPTYINNGSTLQVGSGGNSGTLGLGNVTDNGTLSFNRNDGGLTIGIAINGSGGLLQNGGVVTLTGSNSYTGATIISSGELQIGIGGSGASIGSTSGVTNYSCLVFNHGDAVTFNPIISGFGSLMQTGSGTLILTNSNSYSGSTTINGGTLQIGNGGSGASIGSTLYVADNASLIFNHGDTVTFNPVISGIGSLTQTGSGALILTNTNVYTGGTELSAGTLSFVNNGLGTSGSIAVTGNATLQWYGSNTQDISSRLVIANSQTATIDTQGNTVTFAGSFGAGSSGALAKAGSGTLVLLGSDTYTGPTIINGGTLQIGNGGSGAWIGSTAGVTDYASLVFNPGNALTFNPIISGSGSLTQTGSGVLILTNANSYTGPTTISGGTLQIGNGGSSGMLGSSPVTNNAALLFDRGDSSLVVSNVISGSGSVIQNGPGR